MAVCFGTLYLMYVREGGLDLVPGPQFATLWWCLKNAFVGNVKAGSNGPSVGVRIG